LVQIVIIPNSSIPILLLIFLAAPFYIPVFEWLKNEPEDQPKNKKGPKKITIRKAVKLFFELYAGPLTIAIYFVIGGEMSLQLIFYLGNIIVGNFLGLALVLLYPIIFYFVFYETKTAHSKYEEMRAQKR
jgi:hypothetical protein